jgi:hypothetical protein
MCHPSLHVTHLILSLANILMTKKKHFQRKLGKEGKKRLVEFPQNSLFYFSHRLAGGCWLQLHVDSIKSLLSAPSNIQHPLFVFHWKRSSKKKVLIKDRVKDVRLFFKVSIARCFSPLNSLFVSHVEFL